MRAIFLTLFILFSLSSVTFAATPENEFTGTFDSTLVVQTTDFWDVDLMPAKDSAKLKFAVTPGASAKVFAGNLYDPFADRLNILFAIVAPAGESPFLYVDVNHNKLFETNERFELVEENRPNHVRATVNLPMNNSRFHSFPMLVGFSTSGGQLKIWQTKFATVFGTVNIKGKKVRVAYTYNPLTKAVFYNQRWWGIDSNDDGKIDLGRMSVEAAFSINETRILKVGDTFVSTKSADLAKDEIVLQEHPASDYKRVELTLGSEMPDFMFAGIGKNKRHLSELRGNYVLLYLWGPLCDSCYEDLAQMHQAYTTYHSRGLEMVGLYISSLNEQFVGNIHVNFPMVTESSISAWVKHLYLSAYPVVILLDRNGKIISRGLSGEGEMGLRGAELPGTMRKLFP